jgi:Domain of unknown function (DUF4301)
MSERRLFGDRDLQQMERLGLAPEEALRHVELFRNPPPYTRVLRPCTLGDGIRAIAAEDEPELTARFEEAAAAGRIHKFVPASGAASRMFQPLLEHLEQLEPAAGPAAGQRDSRGGDAPPPPGEVRTFFDELRRFAFFEELAAATAARGVRLPPSAPASEAGTGVDLPPADRRVVLACLLTAEGLGYAERPKGLILFHRYAEGPRTPFEEHLVEAADYARGRDGVCRVHFTVSPRHQAGFRSLLAARRGTLERRLGCRFAVGFSHQRRSTHTLAVDPEHRPFRQADGSLLFRPGGHGALLDNLQQLADDGAGVVLLKNIDNVVPDRLKPGLTRWKKLLGGVLVAYRERASRLLEGLDAVLPDEELIDEAAGFVERELARRLPAAFAAASPAEQRRLLVAALDRPLRVAGVVRNTGEPGGGPFWVEGAGGEVSLQIVEKSQIGPEPDQQAALAASTHFNPVDMACALHDRAGRPYDLARYVDPATVFIAAKSHEGRPLKALERPGLWNGAMAGWNTVFVEVPNSTFAPVKTVLDLLRPEHQDG